MRKVKMMDNKIDYYYKVNMMGKNVLGLNTWRTEEKLKVHVSLSRVHLA
jgi:hypothetical protein